jgi:hypothetical protein
LEEVCGVKFRENDDEHRRWPAPGSQMHAATGALWHLLASP